jgi:hypothetical protein
MGVHCSVHPVLSNASLTGYSMLVSSILFFRTFSFHSLLHSIPFFNGRTFTSLSCVCSTRIWGHSLHSPAFAVLALLIPQWGFASFIRSRCSYSLAMGIRIVLVLVYCLPNAMDNSIDRSFECPFSLVRCTPLSCSR